MIQTGNLDFELFVKMMKVGSINRETYIKRNKFFILLLNFYSCAYKGFLKYVIENFQKPIFSKKPPNRSITSVCIVCWSGKKERFLRAEKEVAGLSHFGFFRVF